MPSFMIVGARFRPPAEDVLSLLPSGADLIIKRQPENPYDVNAVAVLVNKEAFKKEILQACDDDQETFESIQDPMHLGFIPREFAAAIAPVMDLWWQENAPSQEEFIEKTCEWPAKLSFTSQGKPAVNFETPENKRG